MSYTCRTALLSWCVYWSLFSCSQQLRDEKKFLARQLYVSCWNYGTFFSNRCQLPLRKVHNLIIFQFNYFSRRRPNFVRKGRFLVVERVSKTVPLAQVLLSLKPAKTNKPGFLTEFSSLQPNVRDSPAGWMFVIITLHLWGPFGPSLPTGLGAPAHSFMVSLPRMQPPSLWVVRISLISAICFWILQGQLLFVLLTATLDSSRVGRVGVISLNSEMIFFHHGRTTTSTQTQMRFSRMGVGTLNQSTSRDGIICRVKGKE